MNQIIRVFSPHGVITRKEYILTFVGWIVMAFMMTIGSVISLRFETYEITVLAMIAAFFVSYYLMLVATAKRTRDAKITFHMLWLLLLPLLGWSYILGRLVGAPSVPQGDAFK